MDPENHCSVEHRLKVPGLQSNPGLRRVRYMGLQPERMVPPTDWTDHWEVTLQAQAGHGHGARHPAASKSIAPRAASPHRYRKRQTERGEALVIHVEMGLVDKARQLFGDNAKSIQHFFIFAEKTRRVATGRGACNLVATT